MENSSSIQTHVLPLALKEEFCKKKFIKVTCNYIKVLSAQCGKDLDD